MKDLKIHFLNTIWSDAIILESNGHYAFIDTGSKHYYPMIEEYLNNLNIKKLDFILLTHFHSDHYGNMQKIIEDYEVSEIYLKHYYGLEASTGSGSASTDEYLQGEMEKYQGILTSANTKKTKIHFLDDLKTYDATIKFQEIELELYDLENRLFKIYHNPESEFYLQRKFSQNFNSLGVFIRVNNHNIFLGADVTCSKTDIVELKGLSYQMVERFYQKHSIDHIDLYKSCHHGGSGTNTLPLCELLKAKYVVITNTDRWLDTYDTYDNLKAGNPKVTILKTDHQKYVFDIKDSITYTTIPDESLFIKLNLN